MDALTLRAAAPVARWIALVWLTLPASLAAAASYRTANFQVISAPTPQLAKEIGDTAERCRRELAIEWLGRELPNWSQPCPISARVSPRLGAGGETSFVFDGGQVFGWEMHVQGSRERVLDSVIPHEVTHTIFASHFRRPLPRWADEGACTTVEHHSEIAKQEQLLIEFLMTRRGIPFSAMFAMTEYPRDVLPLYAQGHSLARYLIAQRGKREFLAFLSDGMETQRWPQTIEQHYGYASMRLLQEEWLGWVRQGCPDVRPTGGVLLASAEAPARTGSPQWSSAASPSAASASLDSPAERLAQADPARRSRDAAVHDPWLSGTGPRQEPPPAPPAPVTSPSSEELFGASDSVDWPVDNPSVAASPRRGASVYETLRQNGTMYR